MGPSLPSRPLHAHRGVARMATKANSPHDGIFKSAFERPELARSELALILPQAVRAHLDLDTLHVRPGSFRDEDLNQSHSDLLYGVRTTTGEEALVFVLFEHQSEPDPLNMPLRLLRYMARIWERWQIEHPRAKLPIILPVVLHHHAAGWRTEPDFANLLDASPALLEAARPYLPLFRFVLDDLGPLSAEAIAARPLHELARLSCSPSGHRARCAGLRKPRHSSPRSSRSSRATNRCARSFVSSTAIGCGRGRRTLMPGRFRLSSWR